MIEPQRSNFAHCARLQADLAVLGGRAERFFAEDLNDEPVDKFLERMRDS